MQISRNYSETDFGPTLTLDDKITVFEDRVLGWQLEVAELIRKEIERAPGGSPWQHAAFGLLNCLVSYFEMIAQYRAGQSSNGKSGPFFKDGIESVFPGQFDNPQKSAIYSAVRCGLYHNAMTKRGVAICGHYADAIKTNTNSKGETVTLINPHKLSPLLLQHFKSYMADLRDANNTQLRSNFKKFFDQHG